MYMAYIIDFFHALVHFHFINFSLSSFPNFHIVFHEVVRLNFEWLFHNDCNIHDYKYPLQLKWILNSTMVMLYKRYSKHFMHD